MTKDTLEQLEKLADLRGRGILSEEEFQQKKTELLAIPPLENLPSQQQTQNSEESSRSTRLLKNPPPIQRNQNSEKSSQIGLAVTSLIFGILSALCTLGEVTDDEPLDKDTFLFLAICYFCAIIFGGISLSDGAGGKRMATAGLALAGLGLIIALFGKVIP